MREDFLHYLWRLARFDLRDLRTTAGEAVRIQDFGTHNDGAGPDFSHARLRIGGMQWAGNVEMHLQAGIWYDHGHDRDPAYDSVILHVVLTEDRPVYRSDGSRIPCLELRDRIPPGLLEQYWRLLHNEHWVPCQNLIHQVDETVRVMWLERLLVERLTERADRFADRLAACGRDWETAFYQAVARALGGRVNAEAMDMLARSLPLRLLQRHAHSRLQLEALLFGQSGLLPAAGAPTDGDYPALLRREYELLRTKYELRPLPATAWRYLRLRPNNFPTVRIAQLAALLFRTSQLFGKALAATGAAELRNMFVVSLSNYWRSHYRFGGAASRPGERRLGRATIDGILINAVAPAYVAYARRRGEDRYRERAGELLGELPAERNRHLSRWAALGLPARSAAEGQALLQLRQHYCTASRCTSCAVGAALLGRAAPAADPVPYRTGGNFAAGAAAQEPVVSFTFKQRKTAATHGLQYCLTG